MMKVLITAVVALVLLFITALYETAAGDMRTVNVWIIGKTYESSSTDVGYTASGNGGVVVMSKSAQYDMVIEFIDGERALVKTNKETYINVDDQQHIDLSCYYGALSKTVLRCALP